MKKNKPSYKELQLKLMKLEQEVEHTATHIEKMRQAFFYTPVATAIFDINGKMIDCNPTCLSLLGAEQLEAIGRFNLFSTPYLPSEYKIDINPNKEIRFEFIFDYEWVKKQALYPTSRSGQALLNCTIKPFPAEAKENSDGYLVLLEDITTQEKTRIELKEKNKLWEEKNTQLNESLEKIKTINQALTQAKEQAEETQAHLQMIADHLPLFVSHIDNDFRYLFANHYYYLTRGINPKDMIGKTVEEVFGEEMFQNALPFFRRALSGEMTNYETKLNYGSNEQYIHSIYIPNNMKATTHSFFVLGYDVTERKNTELELIAAKERAEESDHLKGAFLQNISHEIRTPLNAIDGFAQLIASGMQSESNIRKFSSMITTNSEKLIEIVTDMILISQIQAKQTTVKRSEIEFIEMIKEIVDSFAERAKEKKLDLSFVNNIHTDKLLIDTDPKKIRKIFTHIVDNALKFTSKGHVQVNCMQENGTIKVSITDTGIGIGEDQQQKVFEPFWQVEGGTSRNYGGNGLGLSIAKAFVEMLEGSIAVLSAPGMGSCFEITIPLALTKNENTESSNNAIKQTI